jgi:outer membrane protein assembly factor BamB
MTMNISTTFAIHLLVATLSLTASRAENWPQFRGPGGNGHSAAVNVPVQWSETENVAWKTPLPGKGWSSPVLVDDRIFLTTAVAAGDDQDANDVDRSLRTLAVDAVSGAVLWNVEIFKQTAATAAKIHRKNSHASATAVVDGDRVYVHFGHMGTACLDREGKLIWKNQDFNYKPVHGNGGCPIIVGEHLIFSCDGGEDPFIVALNKLTGTLVWKQSRETDAKRTFSFSTPTYFEIDGVPQVISPGSNGVSALDPVTGKELWRCNYEGYSVIPKPLLGHGLIYISTGYDNATLMAIKPGTTGEVSATNVAWVIEKRAPHTPSFLLIGDELYFVSDSGMATCADAKTGEIHWQERSGGRAFSASPVFAENRIYLQDERGLGLVITPDKAEFNVLAKNQLDAATLASPTPADGALFIRSATHLYKIAAASAVPTPSE